MINTKIKLIALFTTIAMLARITYERCQAGAEEIERRALSRSPTLSAAQPSCTSHERSSSDFRPCMPATRREASTA
jgi:hypothetical protein